MSVGLSRASARLGLPVALLFLLVGVLAGSEGLGHIAFEDYQFAFRVGTAALVLILFDGGLNTPLASARAVLAPAPCSRRSACSPRRARRRGARTCSASAGRSRCCSAPSCRPPMPPPSSPCSPQAARGCGKRVGLTLEVESGLNDPMAVILTTALTAALVGGATPGVGHRVDVALEMVVGAVVGLRRRRAPAAG